MKHKGGNGAVTLSIVLCVIATIFLGIVRLTQTDIFIVDGNFITTEAGKLSIRKYKESCVEVAFQTIIDGYKDYKDKDIHITGKLKDIESGLSTKCIAIVEIGDNEEVYGYIKVNIQDKSFIRAQNGDQVDVFGRLDYKARYNGKKAVVVKGVRVLER